MNTVQRIHYGTVKLPGRYNPPSFEDARIPVFGYLINTKHGTILVDSGISSDHHYINRTFTPELLEIKHALAQCGVTLADVDCIVNSHLHFDHCGNNRRFQGLPHYVQAAEIEMAQTDNYTIKKWISNADLVPVEGDLEIEDGVTLLSTPGHTPGHQSILVDAGEVKLLIAAQAAFSYDEFLRGGDPDEQAHEGYEEVYVASLNRLKAIQADRIYLSHDVREVA